MAYYVCSGAKLKCSMGSEQSDLCVTHPDRPVRIKGNPMAGMADHNPVGDDKGTITLPYEDKAVDGVEFWGISPFNPVHQDITKTAVREILPTTGFRDWTDLDIGSTWPDVPVDSNKTNAGWRHFEDAQHRWKIWSFQDYVVQKSRSHAKADKATIKGTQMIGYRKALRASKFILMCYKKNVKWNELHDTDSIMYKYLNEVVYAIHPDRYMVNITKKSHDIFLRGSDVDVKDELLKISNDSEKFGWENMDNKERTIWDMLFKTIDYKGGAQ